VEYEELLKEMSSRLIELQGDDGMWRASLLDPVEYPKKESNTLIVKTYNRERCRGSCVFG
jgi:rhamnogalacturonyl hydrolase YesR